MLQAIFKKAVLVSSLFLLLASGLHAAELASLPETREQKVGYTFGYRLGAGIRTDDFEVEFESVRQGIQDGIDGKQPVLSFDEMQTLIRKLSFKRRQERAGETPATEDESGPALKEKASKAGYTFGYQLGESLRTDQFQLDIESTMRGFQDAMDGKQPVLDSEEMKNLFQEVRTEKRDKELREVQQTIVKNQEESTQFLEENGKKEGIHTTESGLQYRVLKDGDGPSPKLEDMVKVHYKGTFIDGTEFDNSYAKGAPERIETDGVIKGWTEALQMMKVGSKWQLFVPPELGFGRRGLGERIPPNKVLVFEMELVSIEEPEE